MLIRYQQDSIFKLIHPEEHFQFRENISFVYTQKASAFRETCLCVNGCQCGRSSTIGHLSKQHPHADTQLML